MILTVLVMLFAYTGALAAATTDLKSLLTGAIVTINGTEYDQNATWSLVSGDEYTVKLVFTENDQNQFENNTAENPLVYQLPDGFQMGDNPVSASFDIDLGTDGMVSGNTYTYEPVTNTVTVWWKQNDQNYNKLTSAGNLSFFIALSGSFDTTQNQIEFNDSVIVDLEEDDSHNVSVYKTGYYDNNDNKIHYTVTVNSHGVNENVKVTDNLYGSAITLDQNSFTQEGNSSEPTTTFTSTGFTKVFPSMANGETVTITYTASVDINGIEQSGNAKVTETGNSVKVEADPDDDPGDDTSTHYESQISFSDFSKTAVSVGDKYTDDQGNIYKEALI